MPAPARGPRRRLGTALLGALVVTTGSVVVPGPGAVAAPAAVELLVNGGFEDVTGLVFNAAGWATVRTGGTLPGWQVTEGSVEVDRSLAGGGPWNPSSGSHSLDLNGDGPGALAQQVEAREGATYRLTFAAAVHPQCGPDEASVVVRWQDDVVAELPVAKVGDPSDPGWTARQVDVRGSGGTAVLELVSGVRSGSCGPVLDDVSLVEVAPPAPTELVGVQLTSRAPDVRGPVQVPVSDVPLDQVPPALLDDVAGAPLRSVPLRSVPLRSVPLRSVPLRSVPLRSVPLRSVTLNQVPLLGSPGWTEVLAGTELEDRPLQQVTLDEVLALDPPGLADVDLDSVDLSASPLRSISLASVYLGPAGIDDLPLDPTDLDGSAYADWCAAVAAATAGDTCTTLGLTPRSPVLALDLAAVPLRSVPLRSVPLRSVPVTAPLRSVPLRSVPLRSVPLRSVPLRSVDGVDVAAVDGLAGLRLSDLAATSVLRAALTPRYGGSATLAELAVAPDRPLEQFTLGDVGPFTGALEGLTIGDVADHVAASVTLGDALLSLLDPDQVPWESLPLDVLDLPRYDTDGPLVRFTAAFALAGDGPVRDAEVRVTLPAGVEFAGGVQGTAVPPVVDDGGRTVSWSLAGLAGGPAGATSISFDARLPLSLGTRTAELSVDVPAAGVDLPALTGAGASDVTVVDTTATDADDAPVVAPDTLLVGHTATPDRPGYVRVRVPAAGTRVSVFLGQLGIDHDLVVYGPGPGSGAPSPGAAPLRSIPLRSVPLPDPGVDATGALTAPAVVQDDLPLRRDLPLVGASAQRGTTTEQVDLLSDGADGFYTVQVSGYNGASSPQPWVLRVSQVTPGTTACPPSGLGAQTGTTDELPGGVDATTRSLFLLNEQQLRAEYPDDDVDRMVDRLEAVAARADVRGALVRVDASRAVTQAYTRWNADPCSIDTANSVVDAVSGLVVRYAQRFPSISSVVLVGGDQQVPMGRVPDLTVAVNERGFAPEARGTDPDGERFDNPFSAAFAAGYVLSDDPYGTTEALGWLDRELYVPRLAVGRLVETPTQVEGQLAQFEAAGGVVDPTTALTTGYDFLTDGAQAVDAGLASALGSGATRSSLISEVWTRGDLVAGLVPDAGPAPSIVSVNAHFDASRALPADGNAADSEDDLFVTTDVTTDDGFDSRLLFSMGCHAGLSVPAGYSGIAGAPASADWPKAFASKGALWIANTGYGLGDTATVALSEELMAGYAERLDGSLTAGEALVFAKQAYVGSLGVYGSADEKVLQQIAFYGLPMWRIGGAPSDGSTDVPLPAPPPLTTVVPAPVPGDPSGLLGVQQTLTPTFTRVDSPDGSFWDVDGETQTTAGLPIQPRTSRPATPAGTDVTGRGVLVTSLRSRDVPGVDPRFARAVLDSSVNEPEQELAGVTFPAGLASLSTVEAPAGQETRLVVLPGQFTSPPGITEGTQRLFDEVGTTTYYSDAPAYLPPTFRTLAAERVGSTVTFTVDVSPADGESVVRVLVLARDAGRSQWVTAELTRAGALWRGSVEVRDDSVEWFAQAVSSAGNVGTSANKGALFASDAEFLVGLDGPVGGDDVYTGPVTVRVQGPAATYTAAVDGGPPQQVTGSGLVVTGDGVRRVEVVGTDGDGTEVARTALTFRIDTTAPEVTVRPAAGGTAFTVGPEQVGTLSCTDGGGSGLAVACPDGGVAVDTSVPGVRTVPLASLGLAPVADRAGNTTTTVSWTVRYAFGGFERPLGGDGPASVRAGSALPVRFALRDTDGPVVDLGAVLGIASQQVPCPSATPDGSPGPAPVEAVISTLRVSGQGFGYVWKTERAWAGTCRELQVRLRDGTTRTATVDLS